MRTWVGKVLEGSSRNRNGLKPTPYVMGFQQTLVLQSLRRNSTFIDFCIFYRLSFAVKDDEATGNNQAILSSITNLHKKASKENIACEYSITDHIVIW